jgi:hypothetical protein
LIINQIIEALEDLLGVTIPDRIIALLIAAIDIDAIVADIIADVEVSLGILEACLPPTTPINGAGVGSFIGLQPPTTQQDSQVFTFGDSMLQMR